MASKITPKSSAYQSMSAIKTKTKQKEKKSISIVAPMFNEEEVIPLFFQTLEECLAKIDIEYEIVCVDDGSTDNTLAIVKEFAISNHAIKVISFSRNFGKEAAMSAALDFAKGDAVIPIDVDLQDPPELIVSMIEKWREGSEVVVARRVLRDQDSWLKRISASWFYKLFNRISDTEIPYDVGDFRLMDSRVVSIIKQLPEKDRFMKGLYCWPGFKHAVLDYERPIRAEGETKFSFWKLWNFALNGITSFSTMPIRFGTYVGLFIALLSFIYAIFIITKTVFLGIDVPGYASLLVIVLFLGGVQLFFLGLLGEYIGRIYKEVKNRPLYIVSETIGFESEELIND